MSSDYRQTSLFNLLQPTHFTIATSQLCDYSSSSSLLQYNQIEKCNLLIKSISERKMKLALVSAFAGKSMGKLILHEAEMNIAIESEKVTFYNEHLEIDADLLIRSSCSTLQNFDFQCSGETRQGSKINEALDKHQDVLMRACARTTADIINIHMHHLGNGRSRRNAIMAYGKKMLTEISPLCADAVNLLEIWVPKAVDAFKAWKTGHKGTKSTVVINKSDFEKTAAKVDICSKVATSSIMNKVDNIHSSIVTLGKQWANRNMQKIEKLFLAIKSENFESSNELEDFLITICTHHLPIPTCQALIDLGAIQVTPLSLKMSHQGDALLKVNLRLPTNFHTGKLYYIYSNGRINNGNLEKLKIANHVLNVKNAYYDASGISCRNNQKHKICSHNVLTKLGCEEQILQKSEASTCPIEVTPWDTSKPKILTAPTFALFSSLKPCTICVKGKSNLEETCHTLPSQSIVTRSGLITCNDLHLTWVTFPNGGNTSTQVLQNITYPEPIDENESFLITIVINTASLILAALALVVSVIKSNPQPQSTATRNKERLDNEAQTANDQMGSTATVEDMAKELDLQAKLMLPKSTSRTDCSMVISMK